MKKNYLSPEGYKKLKDEHRELTTKGRREVAQKIEEARSHGDLSENAEYDAAKEEQGHLEKRIAELEQTLSNSRVLDEKNMDNSKVYVLSTVKVFNKKTNKEVSYTLVSKDEADFEQGKISIDSPIGSALMGKAEGDTVKVEVPAGTMELEIKEITR